MKPYRTIGTCEETRINIAQSIFLTKGKEVRSMDEVRGFRDELRVQYPDATHCCTAWILEMESGSDDDGEPTGTGGQPILNVLRHQGLSMSMIGVVRYFGGHKLGIRGLIEAYGAAASGFIKNAMMVERVPGEVFWLSTDYAYGSQLVNPKAHPTIRVLDKGYGETVELKLFVPVDMVEGYLEEFEGNGVTILRRNSDSL